MSNRKALAWRQMAITTIKLTLQSAYSRVNSASIGQQTEEIYVGVWLLLRVLTLS